MYPTKKGEKGSGFLEQSILSPFVMLFHHDYSAKRSSTLPTKSFIAVL